MDVRRTVPVKLDVDSDDAALLEDTVDTFLWSAQYVVDHAFEGEYVTTSKTTLDDETYDDVREVTDGFNGGLVQAARNKAAEACKSVVAKWKQGKKASKPHFTSPHVVYDHRTATFHDDYVSLATTDGRIEADYVLPAEDSDTPHADYFFPTTTRQQERNCTTATATGCSTSTTRRKWSPTRRQRRPPRTERFLGLTSA
jgi:putative transposase